MLFVLHYRYRIWRIWRIFLGLVLSAIQINHMRYWFFCFLETNVLVNMHSNFWIVWCKIFLSKIEMMLRRYAFLVCICRIDWWVQAKGYTYMILISFKVPKNPPIHSFPKQEIALCFKSGLSCFVCFIVSVALMCRVYLAIRILIH